MNYKILTTAYEKPCLNVFDYLWSSPKIIEYLKQIISRYLNNKWFQINVITLKKLNQVLKNIINSEEY